MSEDNLKRIGVPVSHLQSHGDASSQTGQKHILICCMPRRPCSRKTWNISYTFPCTPETNQAHSSICCVPRQPLVQIRTTVHAFHNCDVINLISISPVGTLWDDARMILIRKRSTGFRSSPRLTAFVHDIKYSPWDQFSSRGLLRLFSFFSRTEKLRFKSWYCCEHNISDHVGNDLSPSNDKRQQICSKPHVSHYHWSWSFGSLRSMFMKPWMKLPNDYPWSLLTPRGSHSKLRWNFIQSMNFPLTTLAFHVQQITLRCAWSLFLDSFSRLIANCLTKVFNVFSFLGVPPSYSVPQAKFDRRVLICLGKIRIYSASYGIPAPRRSVEVISRSSWSLRRWVGIPRLVQQSAYLVIGCQFGSWWQRRSILFWLANWNQKVEIKRSLPDSRILELTRCVCWGLRQNFK